ncbi:hypothetical protein [Bradyrhizobium sp. CB2312]|uniref:hypothetical protein n=1 Tax=Bradyrhizobium sp. CB2312 TaxID=3039155 RepID=UPI0024B03D89|nr:hypothetical protein [Bradyrhizobium sp. CB2312]WFU71243.1 hypothetical protein QA642_39465 [Bradyrhizobium sp. CB2312]
MAELITKTLARKPKVAPHWSIRVISNEMGIAKSTAYRLFQLFGLERALGPRKPKGKPFDRFIEYHRWTVPDRRRPATKKLSSIGPHGMQAPQPRSSRRVMLVDAHVS